jgi:hypothetical protein
MRSHYALDGDVFAAVLRSLRRVVRKPLLASQW